MTRRLALALILGLAGACEPGAGPLDAGPLDAGPLDAEGPADVGAPDAGPPLEVLEVTDLGALPHPSDAVAGRDGASSGVIGGRLLWTFGDTFLYVTTPWDGSHVATATGAWASPDDPLTLEQPVDAMGVPSQLVPYTDTELAENVADALNGWALWPCGVIDTGEPDALLLFQRIDRIGGSGFEGVGVGTARIAPGETVARRDEGDLFSRPAASRQPLFGPGGVAVIDDAVHLFACEAGGCRLARAPRARADERAAYEFWDGAAWVSDESAAAIVIYGVGALSVSYNAHLGRYLAVSSQPLSNDVVLRTAPRIEGPWPVRGLTLRPADGGILAAGEGSNYLAQEHVALSDPDGRSIVISYSRPLGSFRGEVRLARITFR